MATRRGKKKTVTGVGSSSSNKRKILDLAARNDDDDDDEHIHSSDDDEHTPSFQEEDLSSEEENLDVKKVRLAREYLDRIDAVDDDGGDNNDSDGDSGDDNDDDKDDDAVSRRLQLERLKRQGALERDYADTLQESVAAVTTQIQQQGPADAAAAAWIEHGYVHLLPGHDLTPTSVSLTGNATTAVSGSKDHSVLVWDVETQTKVATLCEHWKKSKDGGRHRTAGQTLAVACSDDGRYAAVGKRDAIVSIYDIRAGKYGLIKTFAGHKGAVTSLAFRTQSHQLFSGSEDRCIRHYNLDEMLYLETLYGHQLPVTGLACHRAERPVSVSRDRTARAWKLAEDAHLIFRGGAQVAAADAVAVLRDDWFVTGHADGGVHLWRTETKRAAASVARAHGGTAVTDDGTVGRGVVSIAGVRGSDVVATGSNDGYLRLWKVSTGRTNKERGIDPIGQIPVPGCINGIAFASTAEFCVAAVGQEHRCGRWERVPRAKNRIAIIKLRVDVDHDADEPTAELDFEALD